MIRHIFIAAGVGLLAACSSATPANDLVSARVTSCTKDGHEATARFTITNNSGSTVATLVFPAINGQLIAVVKPDGDSEPPFGVKGIMLEPGQAFHGLANSPVLGDKVSCTVNAQPNG